MSMVRSWTVAVGASVKPAGRSTVAAPLVNAKPFGARFATTIETSKNSLRNDAFTGMIRNTSTGASSISSTSTVIWVSPLS